MRPLFVALLVLLLPAAAGCGDSTSSDSRSTRGVPRGAIATESLDSMWHFTLRSVIETELLVESNTEAMVAAGVLEFASADGGVGVVFNVENFDPRASGCHPNGVILDDDCADPGSYPYVLLQTSAVSEIYINGRRCMAPNGGTAVELTADDAHSLHRLRAVAPVVCPGGDVQTFEIRLERTQLQFDATGMPKPPTSSDEPILIGADR